MLGLNLLLLLDQRLGAFGHYWRDEIIPLRKPSHACAKCERATPALRSLKEAAISRHCCPRRRYSNFNGVYGNGCRKTG